MRYSLWGFSDTRWGNDSDDFPHRLKIRIGEGGRFLGDELGALGVRWAANIEMGGVSTSFAGSGGRDGAVGESMIFGFAVVAEVDKRSFECVGGAVSRDVTRLVTVVTVGGLYRGSIK